MKKILPILTFLFITVGNAQIINIPDANFKTALLNHDPVIDTNGDGEIQETEAENYNGEMFVFESTIYDLTGIEAFVNITSLFCWSNSITTIDLTNNIALEYLYCSGNDITSIDLSNNINLGRLLISNNNLTELDLSNNHELFRVSCTGNPDLTYVNLKNGNNSTLYQSPLSNFGNSPSLLNVCIDDINSNLPDKIIQDTGHVVYFTEYCSLTSALNNQINGNIKLDLNNNGCDTNDATLPNLMIVSSNGNENFATFTQDNGDYLLYTSEGNFTTTVTANLPSYFTVNPTTQTNTFTDFDNTFTADFCIEPNQTINDLYISLIPPSEARPGFDTNYQIVYKNVGTTQLNGNVTLNFDNTKLNFLNASETVNTQTSNSLTFNYANLNPFEIRTIDIVFNVFAPPTVNIEDVLNFTATINPIAGDYTTGDNVFTLSQTVIGSYDPNDITCLEGDEILLEDADKYLHYVIRFQNTGTASAINVVVKNILDDKLDWSTLQLESLSHDNRVAIKNGNEIEFIFEDINLADSTTDEPNSHGFIAYKIKPKSDVILGDVFNNKADIFFDFNEAIETNTATTTIVNVLAVNENSLLDFSIYPTPTENMLTIKSKTEITKIEIFNKLGQLVLQNVNQNTINISNLSNDLYFCKAVDFNGNFGVRKVIKH